MNTPASRYGRVVILTLLVVAMLGLLAGLSFVYFGVYNVSALRQHTQLVYSLIDDSLRASISRHASAIDSPDLQKMDWRGEGLRLYVTHCRQCHGAPGVSPESFSFSLTPVPTAIVRAGRKLEPAEVFWVVEQGIKMSGMPGWEYRLSDREIWQIVAFVKQVPYLSVAEYRALARAAGVPASPPPPPIPTEPAIATGSVEEGRRALQQYGCISCHSIPGITGAVADVGPPLKGIADRAFIAGQLANTRENMIRWLRFPQQVDPQTAMPTQGVGAQDAVHMAAYLETLTGP